MFECTLDLYEFGGKRDMDDLVDEVVIWLIVSQCSIIWVYCDEMCPWLVGF